MKKPKPLCEAFLRIWVSAKAHTVSTTVSDTRQCSLRRGHGGRHVFFMCGERVPSTKLGVGVLAKISWM